MMTNKSTLVSLLCCLLLFPVGCKKRETTRLVTSSSQPGDAKFDVCGLITKEEIQAVMGSPINETKSSANSGQGFRTLQCFYATTEFSRSVSLAVTQSDSDSPVKRSVKEFWKETFGRYEGEQKETEADKEKKESLREQGRAKDEEEERNPPKKIDGIGEAAYWTSSRVGGALYVLKKDALIRISVGGADTQEAKIDKSKALAEKALARM
jgi:hypothetical protein